MSLYAWHSTKDVPKRKCDCFNSHSIFNTHGTSYSYKCGLDTLQLIPELTDLFILFFKFRKALDLIEKRTSTVRVLELICLPS
jgi:hypothetical protein